MFAGTSTGSILSSALSLAKYDGQGKYQEPLFWADQVLDIYITGRPIIFTKNVGGAFYEFLCYAVYFIIFATIFFLIGRYKYNNPKKLEAFKKMKALLDENKANIDDHRKKNEEIEREKTKIIIEAIEEVK